MFVYILVPFIAFEKGMRKSIVIIILLLLITSGTAPAETADGRISLDFPDTPRAKFQFHFTRELIALAATTAPFDRVTALYIRTYDYDADIFNKFVQYYSETLKLENWQSLHEDSDAFLSILEARNEGGEASNGVVLGIFGVLKSDSDVHLLNIIGDIPQQQIGQLLGNLNQLGIEISALESLDAFKFQKFEEKQESVPLPTLFRTSGEQPNFFSIGFSKTGEGSKFGLKFSMSHNENLRGDWRYYGHPIEKIHIHSDSKRGISQVRQALQEGSVDIQEVLNNLPSPNTSEYKQKLIVRAWERSATIIVGNVPDHKNEPSMLSKQFRTEAGEPVHEILIKGHQNMHPNTVRKALEEGPEEIEKAIAALPSSIPDLERIRLRIEEKDSRRTAILTVTEKPKPARFDFEAGGPVITFNRVTGWGIGIQTESVFRQGKAGATTLGHSWPRVQKADTTALGHSWPSDPNGSRFFGEIGYGFGNKQVYYRVGGDAVTRKHDWWNFGLTAQFQRTTDTINPDFFPNQGTSGETFFRVLGEPDYRNYYLRTGFEAALRWEPMIPNHLFKLSLLGETHESLQKSTDWHFFNWRSKSKARENPEITDGPLRSVTFRYDFNTRNDYLGWYNTFFVEHSNSTIGSDFDFTRYQLHLRYAHSFGSHRIRTRAVGSFSTASLPAQRQFIIGGPGLLNGYPPYAFAGDRGFLFNIEYFYNLQGLMDWKNVLAFSDLDLLFVIFVDAGQAWNVSNEKYIFEPKSAAGIGLQLGETDAILRFNVSKAFEVDQGIQFNTVWFYSF